MYVEGFLVGRRPIGQEQVDALVPEAAPVQRGGKPLPDREDSRAGLFRKFRQEGGVAVQGEPTLPDQALAPVPCRRARTTEATPKQAVHERTMAAPEATSKK